ncbi:MAG: hypothetical protein JRH10_04740 [Deltaproteobacteria bacterium]|nr:hypothetical protein [Deltaproteobacteria bacterium]MBW2448434.1 hypothetical protein [Deltaproteobacteria bacterium]
MNTRRFARGTAACALLLTLSACATARPPRPIPETHTLVPGSRVSLAAPAGFILDAALPGFGSPDGQTAIFVNELPGSVYATMRSFSGEGFQKGGMLLRTQERVTVDGWPARLYRASQPVRDADLGRFVLVFGDSSRSVVLTAVTPEATWADHAAALRAALLSARWHREGTPPPSDPSAAGS